jgi:hypothetical protein
LIFFIPFSIVFFINVFFTTGYLVTSLFTDSEQIKKITMENDNNKTSIPQSVTSHPFLNREYFSRYWNNNMNTSKTLYPPSVVNTPWGGIQQQQQQQQQQQNRSGSPSSSSSQKHTNNNNNTDETSHKDEKKDDRNKIRREMIELMNMRRPSPQRLEAAEKRIEGKKQDPSKYTWFLIIGALIIIGGTVLGMRILINRRSCQYKWENKDGDCIKCISENHACSSHADVKQKRHITQHIKVGGWTCTGSSTRHAACNSKSVGCCQKCKNISGCDPNKQK